MSKRKPSPVPLFDELYPLLISRFRKLMKLPAGPKDHLQTREFRSLIEMLLSEKDLSTRPHLAAYLMYDFPMHYAEGLSLLKELPQTPNRVLEVGSISAPFALSALQHGASEVYATGAYPEALSYGADIIGHLGYTINLRDSIFANNWDLIIAGYQILEHPLEKQLNIVHRLLNLLDPNGHLLLVEPSEDVSNRLFLKLRDALCANGTSILAPCLWKGNCPALQHGSSVCFTQRTLDKHPMIKEIQRAAHINLSSLKMSYLILKAPGSHLPERPHTLYRVVSPYLNTFRGNRYFLCGAAGQKTLGTTLKEHPKESKAFEYIQRGDVLEIQHALELENDLQVRESTVVTLKAPADKPVP